MTPDEQAFLASMDTTHALLSSISTMLWTERDLLIAISIIRQQQAELTELRRAIVDFKRSVGLTSLKEAFEKHSATITRAQEALRKEGKHE